MLDVGSGRHPQRGQMLVLFAFALTAIVMAVGLVVDGGYALAQRRASQNAADFAALAGARVVAEKIGGNSIDGKDANVQAAIITSINVNGGAAISFGWPDGPIYVDGDGAQVGYVGAGSIPSNAVGVRVGSSRTWKPFFLGIAGINSWSASATATARGGYYDGPPIGGAFPAGIAEAVFNGRSPCVGDPTSNVGGSGACDPVHLTPGSLNVPGGFGWLKFGCDGYGLGQVAPANAGGCSNDKPFLQTEMNGSSYGCCTAAGQGGPDLIGSLPGNKASADCSAIIASGATVTVAVWDYAGGSGSGAYYHVVGFTGWQITECHGGKDLEGVFRQEFFQGPTTTTPGFAGAPLAVQLIQ